MFRDAVGGRATNLTVNEEMQDIYKLVAERTVARLHTLVLEDPEQEALRKQWLDHGVSRKVCKRSVDYTSRR